MSAPRRSTRERRKSAYTTDAFHGLDLGDSDNERETYQDDDSADEYQANEEADEVEDELSLDEGSDRNASAEEEEEEDAGMDDEAGSMVDMSDVHHAGMVPLSAKQYTKPALRKQQAEHWRSRGVIDPHKNKGPKDQRVISAFGTGKEDLQPLVKTQQRWFDITTLPTRKANAQGIGGMAYSYFYTEEMRRREAEISWAWFFSQAGREAFQLKQKIHELADGTAYLPKDWGKSLNVLLGPYKQQKLLSITTGDSIDLNEGWVPNDTKPPASGKRRSREGWVINAGGEIQSMEWVPHQDGIQYLSLSVKQGDLDGSDKENRKPFRNPKAPAFHPSPTYPVSLQIWEIHSADDGTDLSRIDAERKPCLKLVICADWGYIRAHKWCPVPRPDGKVRMDDRARKLGLLAIICSDGVLRILDVDSPDPSWGPPTYIYVDSVVFEVRPPGTVITCLCWLSDNHIAAGCADGTIAIWSLSKAILSPSPTASQGPHPPPRPWFFHQVHDSYILSLTSGYPSRPNYIASTSMDGYSRMTDIRAPSTDTVVAPRVRVGIPDIVWNDITQSFIGADDSHLVRMYPARRFYSLNSTARTDAPILSLATSLFHPATLMATTDGKVFAVNPLRRLLETKVEPWQQIWFCHEWRGPIIQHDNDEANDPAEAPYPIARLPPEAARTTPPDVLQNPLVRFTDGYRLVNPSLATNYQRVPGHIHEGTVFTTIYDRECAVTRVRWNPNRARAGWAAAGMGDGCVRVEDIAI